MNTKEHNTAINILLVSVAILVCAFAYFIATHANAHSIGLKTSQLEVEAEIAESKVDEIRYKMMDANNSHTRKKYWIEDMRKRVESQAKLALDKEVTDDTLKSNQNQGDSNE
jgi:hypothetical protein